MRSFLCIIPAALALCLLCCCASPSPSAGGETPSPAEISASGEEAFSEPADAAKAEGETEAADASSGPDISRPPAVPETASSAAETAPAIPEPVLPPESDTPVFSVSSGSVKVGRNVFLWAQNIPEGADISGESSLGTVPVFYPYRDGLWISVFPVRYSAAPGEYTITLACGETTQTLPLTVLDGEFETEVFEVEQSVADSTVNSNPANEEYASIMEPVKASGDPEQYWSGSFVLPIRQENFRISSSFGYTRIINGVSSVHGGVDFPAPAGTPVTAPNRGRVLYAGFLQLTGYTVVVEHGFGLKSWYYHMSDISCAEGDMLETGDPIGQVGSTGYSTGNHLHFGMSVGGVYTDPWQYIDRDYLAESLL